MAGVFEVSSFSISKNIFVSRENLVFNFNIFNSWTSVDITKITIGLIADNGYSYYSGWTKYIPYNSSATLSLSMMANLTATQRSSKVTVKISAEGIHKTSGAVQTSSREVAEAVLLNRYYRPKISKFELFRADDGVRNDEGSDVLSTVKLSTSTGTASGFNAYLYCRSGSKPTTTVYGKKIDLTSKISTLLSSGFTESGNLITDTFPAGDDWYFLLYFGDDYEQSVAHFSIGKTEVNVHLAGEPDGKGVCFGGFCKRSDDNKPQFECHYQSRFYDSTVFEGDVSIFGNLNVSTDGKSITLGYASTLFEKYPEEGWDPKLSISGSVAHLSGMITPTGTITGGTNKTDQYMICEIPVGYAPKNIISVLQQGTGTAMWLLRVYPSNHTLYPCKVTFARYRNGSSYAEAKSGDWLPFSATWIF